MRRGWFVALGLAIALSAGFWLHKKSVADQPAETSAPSFHRVEVVAQGQEIGLTLTGTVKSASGQALADAEVFLAATNQPSLVDVRCGVCTEWLLGCHAHETARSVSMMLAKHQGEHVASLSVRSDAQGHFRFERLKGTSFTVWGRAAGWGDGVKERAAPGDPVELILPHPRKLSGRLLDETGKALEGTVRLTSRRLARVLETTSNATGAFEFQGLGEGPFAVSADAPGWLPTLEGQAEAEGAPLVLTLKAPRRLEIRVLSNGSPVDAVISVMGDHLSRQLEARGGLRVIEALYPGELMVSASLGELSSVPTSVRLVDAITQVTLSLERGGTLAVTVLDEADQPVQNPRVELLTRGQERIAQRTLQTGELSLFGPVGIGEYSLRAAADGYQGVTMPVIVKPGETSVEVTLSKGTVISGRVTDEYGRPAPGVPVLVSPTGDSLIADSEGRFSALVPSPGLYQLYAHHSDWGGGEVKVQAPKEGVELQLEPRAGAEIAVSFEGRPVEGASVSLFHTQGSFRSDRASGSNGVILMRGLPENEYTVVATHPDFLPSDRHTLQLREREFPRIAVELKQGSKIQGQVVDLEGIPIAGVTVTATPKSAEPALSDTQGQFTLTPLHPQRMYNLRVVQKGFVQAVRVSAKPGGAPVKVVLNRQRLFRGRVLGEGQPLHNFRVAEHEVTSSDGRFELPLTATEQKVVVNIEAPGYQPLVVERPTALELGDFDLAKGTLISGTVRDNSGGVVGGAVVTCEHCQQSVLTTDEGRFSLYRPPLQKEFTVVAKKGRRSATRTVTEGASQGLDLILKPGTKVSGVAYLPNGQPAAGLEVAAINGDRGDSVSAVTNADGSYALELAPGIYRLTLVLPIAQSPSIDPPAVIFEVGEAEARLDFGPVPGLGTLTVRLVPQRGYALWLVRGQVRQVANPPMELLHSQWAQLVYQPRTEQVILGALAPGTYTLIWASFHNFENSGPVVVPVSIPASGEIILKQ